MVHHTLKNKDHWRIVGMWEAGQTQTVFARRFGINQSQVSRLIAKYRQTNDVTDRPRSGRPRLSSAADDRLLVRSAVRDPKTPCSDLRQQWQNLNVRASTRTVNRRLNKAGLKACRPRCRTFLTLDHRRNRVQWATNNLCWNLRTWRRIYWSDESRFLLQFTDGRVRVWRRRGQDPFQDNVVAETEMFGGGSIMVWGCFTYDHKLQLKVVRQTLTGQRYIDNILQPIVYPHFRAHQAARPIFQDDNARPHRARVVTDSLAQEGIDKLPWPSRSPDMNPIEHCWDRIGRNVYKRNDVATLNDLACALVDEWNNLDPRFLRKLVQGMPRRVRELHQRGGGYTRY